MKSWYVRLQRAEDWRVELKAMLSPIFWLYFLYLFALTACGNVFIPWVCSAEKQIPAPPRQIKKLVLAGPTQTRAGDCGGFSTTLQDENGDEVESVLSKKIAARLEIGHRTYGLRWAGGGASRPESRTRSPGPLGS